MENHKMNGFGTKAIHHGIMPDPTTGAIMTPIYQTSTFVQHAPGKPYYDERYDRHFEYARTDNPTRIILEENLAALESEHISPDKLGALCFASGLAATDAIMKLLRIGDKVLKGDDLYGGSHRLLDNVFGKMNIDFQAVDMINLEDLKANLDEKTKMIWLETPTNPMLKVCDIAAVCEIVKNYNKNIIVIVDNTFCSPYIQNPLDLGADVVLHSVTKYLGGHSDVVMGAIICKKEVHFPFSSKEAAFPAKDTTIYQQLRWLQNAVGAIPGILDCFLTLRGIKTLHLRMEQHSKNAAAVAEVLLRSEAVESVYYPGLKTHENHEIADKQMRLFGGMVSFRLKDDTFEASSKLMTAFKIFKVAESLGGVESMANLPIIMTHGAMKEEERQRLGITPSLIRLSVGIENTADLVADVEQALEKFMSK